jgi:(1->4)-alpha-D-glucan 1-alpha-D-glucosylmutase
VEELQSFHERILVAGQYNALAQVVLKVLSPGVPDFYQGQELWDFSLVDPDNRRPVDFAGRREALAGIGESESLPSLRDPKLKLLVTHRLLQVRRRLAHLWMQGDYVPLDVAGPLAEHLIAFGWRGAESQRIELVAVVPRFVQKLIDAERASKQAHSTSEDSAAADPSVGRCLPSPAVWDGTAIAWPMVGHLAATNVFTGEQRPLDDSAIAVGPLLASFPIAVLEVNPEPAAATDFR